MPLRSNPLRSLLVNGIGAPDPLIDRFYSNPPIKGFGAQKQRPHELLWMLWFDEKIYVTLHTYFVSSSLIVHSLRQAIYVLYV